MAKTGIAAIAEGRSDLFRMDPAKLTVREGWNSRDFDLEENKAHVRTLAASIREVGVREPLAGYLDGETFVVTNGESRLRAVKLLLDDGVEIRTVPVLAEPRHASEADLLASQIIRNSGKPFTPIENAKVYARLVDFGWTTKEIAGRVGVTVERVAQILRLNEVTPKVRKHIQKGEVTSSLVQRIQAKAKSADDVEAQVVEAIQVAKAEGKTKATPKHAAATSKPSAAKPSAKKDKGPALDWKVLTARMVKAAETEPGTFGEDEIELGLVMTKAEWEEIKAAVEGRF